VASLSPRVMPRFTIAIGLPAWLAWRTKRNPEYTISDDPTTIKAAARATCFVASATRPAGTDSPKKTTSGLTTPPQRVQSGTTK
jgi:hypothetical protein